MRVSLTGRLILVLALAGCASPAGLQPTGTPDLAPNRGAVGPAGPTASSVPIPTETAPPPDPHTTLVLLGADLDRAGWGTRTDVIMLVTVTDWGEVDGENEVVIQSIPRDLVVWIPCRPEREGWGRFDRINSAWIHGEREWGEGQGFTCVEATVSYNFGLRVAGTGMVDFQGFMDLVDYLGPLRVTPSAYYADWCGDHRNPGGHGRYFVWREATTYEMDGNLALCYARARGASNDLDRNRRQQDLALAAMRGLLPAVAQQMIGDPIGTPNEILRLARLAVQTDLQPWEHLEVLLLALRVRDWPVITSRMEIGEQVAYARIGEASVLFVTGGMDHEPIQPSLEPVLWEGYPGDYIYNLRHIVGCPVYHC